MVVTGISRVFNQSINIISCIMNIIIIFRVSRTNSCINIKNWYWTSTIIWTKWCLACVLYKILLKRFMVLKKCFLGLLHYTLIVRNSSNIAGPISPVRTNNHWYWWINDGTLKINVVAMDKLLGNQLRTRNTIVNDYWTVNGYSVW